MVGWPAESSLLTPALDKSIVQSRPILPEMEGDSTIGKLSDEAKSLSFSPDFSIWKAILEGDLFSMSALKTPREKHCQPCWSGPVPDAVITGLPLIPEAAKLRPCGGRWLKRCLSVDQSCWLASHLSVWTGHHRPSGSEAEVEARSQCWVLAAGLHLGNDRRMFQTSNLFLTYRKNYLI